VALGISLTLADANVVPTLLDSAGALFPIHLTWSGSWNDLARLMQRNSARHNAKEPELCSARLLIAS